jgi:hypothetical protein
MAATTSADPAATSAASAAQPAAAADPAAGVENYGLWSNMQNWLSPNRWTIEKPSLDTWFKWGDWDNLEPQLQSKLVPAMHAMADNWDKLPPAVRTAVKGDQKTLDLLQANSGAANNAAAEALNKKMSAGTFFADNIQSNGATIRNAADLVSRAAASINGIRKKYNTDRQNLNTCTADLKSIEGAMQNMASGLLQAADQIQHSVSLQKDAPKADFKALPNAAIPTDPSAKAIPVTSTAAKPAGVLVHQTAAPGGTGTAVGVGTGIGAAHAGALVTPTSAGGTSADQHVTLAGAATLAPPAAPGAFAAGAPAMPAASSLPVTPAFGLAAGGVAGNPGSTAGLMPFVPSTTNGVTAAGSPRDGRRGSRRAQEAEGGSASATQSGPGAFPMAPPAGTGAFGASARPAIRPGVAKRVGGGPAQPTGVPAGLLGRSGPAAAKADSSAAALRRAGSTRRRRDEAATVEFLDEDAWQADDAGSGLVAPDEAQPTVVAPGPLLHG